MTSDSTPPAKNNKLRYAALALTGLITCAAGVGVGLYFSQPAVDKSEEKPSDEGIPPLLASNPLDKAPFAVDSPSEDITQDFPEATADVKVEVDPNMQSFAVGAPSAQMSTLNTFVALADEELRGGNYTKAERNYRAALDGVDGGVAEASLRFRLALCAEASGEIAEAQRRYRALAEKFHMLTWVNPARLGEARCLAVLGRIDGLAEGILRQALVDQTMYSERIRGELLHLAGRAYCQSFLPSDAVSILSDDALLMPRWVTDPNRQLEMVPIFLKEESPPTGPDGFEVLQQTDLLPDSIYVRANTAVSHLDLLILEICSRSGFACELSESATAALSGRTQQVHINDISLSLLLDGLCTPFGLLWSHDSEGIHVRTTAEMDDAANIKYRQQLGTRLLKSALVLAPDSQQSGHSRIALGIMQYRNGKAVDAAYSFQLQMQLDPRSDVEAEAALNLGKCRLSLGQFDDARNAFAIAMDSASHHIQAQIGAYLYVGRLQIEEGQFKPAVSSLIRALALARDTELESAATMMLGSAYLMSGSPQGASSVLMKHRESLTKDKMRSVAAFLSAFAQFRATILPGPQQRAARSLVTALTGFHPEQEFGAHWTYLCAQAYDELGLIQEAMDRYEKTIQRLPAAPLRDRAIVHLATQYRFDNRLDEAAKLFAGVNADREHEFGQQIAMQAAFVSLDQGNFEAVLKQCRYIVEKSDDIDLRRTALKTMGRAYQLQRNDRAAAYCFAGRMPVDNSSPKTAMADPEVNNEPSGGTP